jgi:hypothetical protein
MLRRPTRPGFEIIKGAYTGWRAIAPLSSPAFFAFRRAAPCGVEAAARRRLSAAGLGFGFRVHERALPFLSIGRAMNQLA